MTLTVLNRRLTERDWNGSWESERSIAATEWAPPIDIFETESEIAIKMELPGVDAKAISVNVETDVLTVRGERHDDRDLKRETYHRMECSNGRFHRSFSLPSTVDADHLRRHYENGLLTLTLPKKAR